MGREISKVIGHGGLGWLERKSRKTEEQPDALIAGLDLAPDAVVADIGAGSGYLTIRLSDRVPRGKVLAVDIQQEMLDIVRQRAQGRSLENVETVLGSITDPRLPENTVDAALLVDAYHEFSHPREMAEGILLGLKPGGKLYLVEYRAEQPDPRVPLLHRMTEQQARKELTAAGFEFVENRDLLPTQHLLVFRKPAG
jgi:ubiquinone/menaquinone biosynthesis C-methylase UbiE